MTLKDALKRIEELERKVRELEARPQVHHHYYGQQNPQYPFYYPPVSVPSVWCGNFGAGQFSTTTKYTPGDDVVWNKTDGAGVA